MQTRDIFDLVRLRIFRPAQVISTLSICLYVLTGALNTVLQNIMLRLNNGDADNILGTWWNKKKKKL